MSTLPTSRTSVKHSCFCCRYGISTSSSFDPSGPRVLGYRGLQSNGLSFYLRIVYGDKKRKRTVYGNRDWFWPCVLRIYPDYYKMKTSTDPYVHIRNIIRNLIKTTKKYEKSKRFYDFVNFEFFFNIGLWIRSHSKSPESLFYLLFTDTILRDLSFIFRSKDLGGFSILSLGQNRLRGPVS